MTSQTYWSNTVLPNLECLHFVESESLTWAVIFDRIWSLKFREFQLIELSNMLVSGRLKMPDRIRRIGLTKPGLDRTGLTNPRSDGVRLTNPDRIRKKSDRHRIREW